jgi:hypothetical protein
MDGLRSPPKNRTPVWHGIAIETTIKFGSLGKNKFSATTGRGFFVSGEFRL